MIVRPATAADALDVLAWRNDPLTRAMSRNHDEIEEGPHLAWFAATLADPAVTLLIGEDDGAKVGMVRIDRRGPAEVSININPAQRSRGHGHALLAAALAGVPGEVIAEILEENVASQRIFERAGFELLDRRDGWRTYRRAG